MNFDLHLLFAVLFTHHLSDQKIKHEFTIFM